MDGLLLRSHESDDAQAEEALIEVSTRYAPSSTPCESTPPPTSTTTGAVDLSSESGLLTALRSQPTAEIVQQVLVIITSASPLFNIQRVVSAFTSQVVQCLISDIVPTFWPVLSVSEKQQLATCLHSPVGLGSIAARLKSLTMEIKGSNGTSIDARKAEVGNILSLLQMILGRPGVVLEMWSLIQELDPVKRSLLWKEYCALVAGSRLLGMAAEAEIALGRSMPGTNKLWVGYGKRWAIWLGKELAAATKGMQETDEAGRESLGSLLSAGFRLGYTDVLVELYTFAVVQDEKVHLLEKVLFPLLAHDKRTYFLSLLRIMAQQFTQVYNTDEDEWWKEDAPQVSGAGALLSSICQDYVFRSHLVEWITSSSGGGIGQPISIRRAAFLVITQDPFAFQEVFEKILNQFADKLWIRHTPIMRQEVLAQFLLLFAGYSHRRNLNLLKRLTRSSTFLNAVSNRLDASSQRARLLGMIVAESFSKLIDDEKNQISFGVAETNTKEAKWWKSIPAIDDSTGKIQDMLKKKSTRTIVLRHGAAPPASSTSPKTQQGDVPADEEDEDEDDDDEFTPYTNPEPDHYDPPTEDATTINRSAPQPPVYIRTLITYLHKTDSYDHQKLALIHSAPLIRRKLSNQSTMRELTSHLPELLTLLVGLHNNMDIPEFNECQLKAVVALVVADPVTTGRMLARWAFDGRSYSIGQRCNILTALGLGVRELAGMPTGLADPLDPAIEGARRLPERAHRLWSGENGKAFLNSDNADTPGKYLAPLSTDIKSALLLPITQKAVSKTKEGTVSSLLRESSSRRFSSRLSTALTDKSALDKKRDKSRKDFLSLIPSAFFLPLTGNFFICLRDTPHILSAARNDGSPGMASDMFLATLLRTLTLILHACGPYSPTLNSMTTEIWPVIKAARIHGGQTVTEAALVAVLLVLESLTEKGVEGRREIVERWGGEITELWSWIDAVMNDDTVSGEGDMKVLAAAVAVKVQEAVEGLQRLLMGVEDV
ncbi:hypothetical protein EX30DRAFT_303421 [Ascodesmis nigricans]|uniref:Telomere length regulation protein conserved domain-containing protein n=1 Tax=Ascodesmis nigricans TaxID=341454 RepID=A0A4S2N4I4_9PEZI|nr:hypothetical protein EX30DRAFT_303421 [Ascodesmis nigricans]